MMVDVNREEARLLEMLRKISYGSVTVYVQNRRLTRIEKIIESIKIND